MEKLNRRDKLRESPFRIVPNIPRLVLAHPHGDRGKPTPLTLPTFPWGDFTSAAETVGDSDTSSLHSHSLHPG